MLLHGFCDASESAYASVVYLQMVDTDNVVHVSLVIAKTKVAPLKWLTIPRLELCGANLLADLLNHVRRVFGIPREDVFAWTDSTIVLSLLSGSPRCFKVFVGNRVSNNERSQYFAPHRVSAGNSFLSVHHILVGPGRQQ